MPGSHPSRSVLFLCTGNYYRSRYAEILFNVEAPRRGVEWVAESRGLACEKGSNVGPLSRHIADALARRGVVVPGPLRFPKQVTEAELAAAGLIIALKEAEHRRYLADRYPAWPDRVTYWHVHDLDVAGPETALAVVEQNVADLIDRLAQESPARQQQPRLTS